MLGGCTLFVLVAAGCSTFEYPRVSGRTYYGWLASSYSPVIQFREHRVEGEGVCFHLDGGKSQLKGFVTLADLSSAPQSDPDLRMEARVYQQAFAEGMSKGMADSLKESTMTSDQQARLLTELDAPVDLEKYVLDWRRGWYAGYDYGKYLCKSLK